MITDFLRARFSQAQLQAALLVLRRFKAVHSPLEDLSVPFMAWTKLEQLEEFLEHRCEGKPLEADTMAYRKVVCASRPKTT